MGQDTLALNLRWMVAICKNGTLATMTPAERVVAWVYAAHADGQTGECWPGMARVARQAGMDERSVARANASLVERKLIKREMVEGKAVAVTTLVLPLTGESGVTAGSGVDGVLPLTVESSPPRPQSHGGPDPSVIPPLTPVSPKLTIELTNELSKGTVPAAPSPEAPPPAPKRVRAPRPPKPPKDPGPLRLLTDYYCAAWTAKYGGKYPFQKVCGVTAARLLTLCGGCLEDAKAVMDRYLSDDGVFYRGHPLGLLGSANQLPRFMHNGNHNGHATGNDIGLDLPTTRRRPGVAPVRVGQG